MDLSDLKIRVPRDVKGRLASRAVENGRSVNAEVVTILKDVLGPDPVKIVIRQCRTREGELFTASLGNAANNFYASKEEKEFYGAVIEKIREISLRLGDVEIEQHVKSLG